MTHPVVTGAVHCNYITQMFTSLPGVNLSRLQITSQGLYSVTPPVYTQQLLRQLQKFYPAANVEVVDMTAGNGGDTLAFATGGYRVVAGEVNPDEYQVLVHNIKQYPSYIRQRIQVLQGSSVIVNEQGVLTFPLLSVQTRIVYFDPPWGGADYKERLTQGTFQLELAGVALGKIIKALDVSTVLCKVPKGYALPDLPASTVWNFKKHDVLVFQR